MISVTGLGLDHNLMLEIHKDSKSESFFIWTSDYFKDSNFSINDLTRIRDALTLFIDRETQFK